MKDGVPGSIKGWVFFLLIHSSETDDSHQIWEKSSTYKNLSFLQELEL